LRSDGLAAESAWTPLSHPVFRALWIASLVSNIGIWMQNVSAAWAMTSLSPSPLMVALVQSATSLPVFVVGLPAGALADIVDRRRLLLVTQSWMLVAAGLLAVLTFVGLMTATTLLALTFALGAGVAMNTPTWQAITSELVPPSELTRAVTLNALPVNIGRAIGPALGGVLVAAAGPALVFALNAVSFVAVLVVVYRWRRAAPRALLPAERVISATRAGIRYACHAPPLIAVLVRLGLFIICASAFWALLPVIARRDLGLSAFGYGLLLGCLGVGAIAGAALLPRVKRRLPLDALIGLATIAFAVVSALTAFWRFIPGLGIAMIVGGVAWIAMMAGLNGSAQTAVPAWVRARALGIYLLVFQGGLGLGSALWGFVAEHVGASIALASAAGGALLGLAAIRRWPLRAVTTLDVTPSAHWPEPHLDVVPAPDQGPVRVEVEYRIDPSQADAFTQAVRDLEPIRRRDGAVNWAVYRDPGHKGRYVESFVVESWVEHLRQHERITVDDRAVEERIRRFHVAGAPPAVTHLIGAY
jgi:MFS family permease/quinol monooxygenase YgiN